MDVGGCQPQHFAQWIPGKPHAVSFIPPQRLEIQTKQAQGQPHEDENRQNYVGAPAMDENMS